MKTGSGTDFLRIDDLFKDFATERTTFIGGSIDVAMGDQAGDSFELLVQTLDKSVQVGGSVNVRGADHVKIDGVGSSSDSDEADVDIGSNLVVRSKLGATVEVDDTNVGGATSIRLGNAGDFVRLQDSLFVRKLEVKLGGGDDTLRFETPVGCATDLSVDGGAGTDALELSANAGVSGKTTIKKIEQTS